LRCLMHFAAICHNAAYKSSRWPPHIIVKGARLTRNSSLYRTQMHFEIVQLPTFHP
jgi:hypothetical protein